MSVPHGVRHSWLEEEGYLAHVAHTPTADTRTRELSTRGARKRQKKIVTANQTVTSGN